MKTLRKASFVVLALLAAPMGAQPDIDSGTITGHNGAHSFVFTMTAGPFRKWAHKITYTQTVLTLDIQTQDNQPTVWSELPKKLPVIDGMRQFNGYVDGQGFFVGRQTWNWGGYPFPGTEVYGMTLKVDGKTWPVPPSFYHDSFDTGTFRTTVDMGSQVSGTISPDGMTVIVTPPAGSPIWTFYKNGQRTCKPADWPRIQSIASWKASDTWPYG